MAVSTFIAVLASVGLAVGLVVFFVVIGLLQGVLTPLRRILADVKYANTAPMLEHGVKGVDQLGRTQALANQIPDPAVRYMQKLGLPVNTDAGHGLETFPARSTQGMGRGWS